MLVSQGFYVKVLGMIIETYSRYINAKQGGNKGNLDNIPMAQTINSYTSPLIIGEVNSYPKLTSIISLSYMLNPKVKYQLLDEPNKFILNI
jgi:hypothetical protein